MEPVSLSVSVQVFNIIHVLGKERKDLIIFFFGRNLIKFSAIIQIATTNTVPEKKRKKKKL